MNYYLTKRKKANRSYWYAFFTDLNNSQKCLLSVSVEKLRKQIGINTRTPLTREKEAYTIVERAISEGLINLGRESRNFNQFVLDFWDFDTSDYIRRKNQKSPNSLGKDYSRMMRSNFENHAKPNLPIKLDIAQVTPLHIENVINALLDGGRLSNATIQKVVQSMAVPLKESARKKLVPHNPINGVDPLVSVYKSRGIYSIKEIQAIIKKLQEISEDKKIGLKPYLAVILSSYTGMRMGEVRALCSEQIQLVNDKFGIILVDRAVNDYAGDKITKGKRNRRVPVPRYLCEELIQMADRNPHKGSSRVFWSEYSEKNPVASSYILKHFYKALEAIGIPAEQRKGRNLDYHSLRHTFNSTLRGRIDDRVLRAVVGHESVKMTDRYTHELEEDILAAGLAVQTIFKETEKKEADINET